LWGLDPAGADAGAAEFRPAVRQLVGGVPVAVDADAGAFGVEGLVETAGPVAAGG
jgi:hypothetical protein